MSAQTEGYLENYNVLRDTVSKIQGMSEPDVDALVPLVEQATKARAACMKRIDAVEKLLGLESSADQE